MTDVVDSMALCHTGCMNHEHFTLFISDLHLDADLPNIKENFAHLLANIAPKADALYILGDFFEAYIGDDDNAPFLHEIKALLRQFTQHGPPTYIMHGNRDFLIGKDFAKATGTTLIPDPLLIGLYGQQYLLMHGDSLCTDDKPHQRLRKITLNKWIQKIVLATPLSFRKKLALDLRKESKKRFHKNNHNIMDVSQSAVTAAMKKHNVNILIHGHTHLCATHKFLIDGKYAKRFVLDAWHKEGHYLRISENSGLESVHFSASS